MTKAKTKEAGNPKAPQRADTDKHRRDVFKGKKPTGAGPGQTSKQAQDAVKAGDHPDMQPPVIPPPPPPPAPPGDPAPEPAKVEGAENLAHQDPHAGQKQPEDTGETGTTSPRPDQTDDASAAGLSAPAVPAPPPAPPEPSSSNAEGTREKIAASLPPGEGVAGDGSATRSFDKDAPRDADFQHHRDRRVSHTTEITGEHSVTGGVAAYPEGTEGVIPPSHTNSQDRHVVGSLMPSQDRVKASDHPDEIAKRDPDFDRARVARARPSSIDSLPKIDDLPRVV